MVHRQSGIKQMCPLPAECLGIRILLFLLGCCSIVQSLAFPPDNRLSQLIHKVWQTDHGLPQNAIYCLAQDRQGFLWLGTENGLARFDGVTFEVFTETSDPPVPHNFASSLLAAKDGTLWVGTRTGGGLWRYRDGRFDVPFEKLARASVYSLAQTADGTVWVGTGRGLFRVTPSDAQIVELPSDPAPRINALAPLSGGALLLGTRDGDVMRIENNTITSVLAPKGLAGSQIKALAYNEKTDELWIARDGAGLHLLRSNVLTHVDLAPEQELVYLQALHLDADGALWVGTMERGLFRYFDGQISRFGPEDGLSDPDVLSLLKDNEGSLWAGTHYGGLNRLIGGKAVAYSQRDGLPIAAVSSILQVTPDLMWVATPGGGLLKYSHCEFTQVPLGPGVNKHATDIRALHQRKNGELWIGTYGGGLICYTTNQPIRVFTTNEGLAEDEMTTILERSNGELWIGGVRNGISVMEPDSKIVRQLSIPDFLRTHVRSMVEDSQGTIWLGTQNGLVRYSAGEFAQVRLAEATELSVRHLVRDPDDTLWIASRDNGLLRLKEGRASRFDPSVGLRHGRIYQIRATAEDLWLAGNQGIERVSRADLARVAGNPKLRLATQLYTRNEGLRTAECGGDASPSTAVDSEGCLWFATKDGLVRIQPQKKPALPPPHVLITAVSADSERIAPADFTTVKPGTTRVQFNYTAPALRNPANVSFKYRMDKVDANWIDAGGSREAVYYNLKPGSHRFQVIASNDEGKWNEQGAIVAFTVVPRLYQALWFQVAAGFAVLSGLGITYRSRLRGIRQRNQHLQTLVAERTQELQTEVEHRANAENNLRLLNEELEDRVKARTVELRKAYDNLEVELHERHQAEQALARSEARLRRIVDSGMVGILFWQKDGIITDANSVFLGMIGYSRDELDQELISWRQLTPPEYLDLDNAALREIQRTGICTPFEKEYIRKDGTRLPVLLGGASLTADADKGVCFVLDISERKASEEEVRRLNMLLEARVQERTTELARTNEQLASEVQERKRVAIALSAFSHLGQKLHSARTEKEAATIVAETARSLIPHDICSIELYDPDGRLTPVLDPVETRFHGNGSAGPQCTISVSIRNGSRVVGILGLKSSRVEGFTFEDANTLQALGDYCGGALDRIHAEEARRELERRFSTFMTNAPALAWMKDDQFRYVFTNDAFQRFTGLTASEIEGKTDFDLWPENVATHMRQNDQETKATQSKRESQESLRRHDGELRTFLALRFLFTTGTGEQYVSGMAIDITEQKRAEEALHRLPHSILDAQEAERRRVARELHDGVNQAIASIKFRIQTAEQQILRADPRWQETWGKTKDMLDAVLQQVRRLSRNLRPGELDDFGLVPAARSACQEMELRTGIMVKFTHSDFPDRLPAPLELSLYRVIQEALTNIERHSSATEVSIDLQEDGQYVMLEIFDNGCGFDMQSTDRTHSGLGLLHMRERATLVRGVFSLISAPGEGVRITIHAPIDHRIQPDECPK